MERSEAGVEGTERSGGLHKRSAEAWGNPLRARGAELPLGAFAVALAFQNIRAGVAGRNRPAEVGSEKTPVSLAAEAGVGDFLPNRKTLHNGWWRNVCLSIWKILAAWSYRLYDSHDGIKSPTSKLRSEI